MAESSGPAGLSRELIALRVAQELREGMVVNLGIGLPTLVSNFLPPGGEVVFQGENGVLGYTGISEEGFDPDLINAGGQPITLGPGASFFDSADSFAMIRGGHIDITILGAFQVAATGDLANWDARTPNKGQLIGGAMDLAAGAKRVHIIMKHNTRDGGARLVSQCDYPLTAPGVVNRIYTDLAVIDIENGAFVAAEIIPGLSHEELAAATDGPLTIAPGCRELNAPDL